MKNRLSTILAAAILLTAGCKQDKQITEFTISPEAGTTYNSGKDVTVKVNFPADAKVDSVVYLVDSVRILSRNDTQSVSIKTDGMKLGSKVITARVFEGTTHHETSTNIVVLAAKAPELLSFVVEKVFPHDTSSYTEGLEFHDGFLYESDGGYLEPPPESIVDGQSSLRKVDLATGKVVQSVLNDPKVFAEGITIVGDKIIQLTYREKTGYVYDKKTFKLLNTFSYTAGREGWGLAFDGEKIYNTDGTNRILILDKDNYRQIDYIDVYDNEKQIDMVNELEYIDGKLYGNVYQSNDILIIDPKTGAVLQKADMSKLYPSYARNDNADVLNGIAWDAKGKRLFVTGKKWDKLFQVKLLPAAK
ncbi:glutaminyl-peptide cyclotransferase [Mucilaginibacter hurinus]|uniref:Glutaminyl-peptide cyclotransferase n=1 Tax=Mucilaginibacter hurinus TaxID=2201324 RepID=A0A367GPP4_9SPHI|nr:glutaminyl-peptide cyclotransferase [Mucilaginibacter hurinus]RCH55058.1 glutaminyl-peptide cyclotransferase [Mucilaginibacter hurinus]